MKPPRGASLGSRRAHIVAAPIEGGVLHHVLDLVRFDPLGCPDVVLPPWPGLDSAARRFAASGARVHRLLPAPRPGGVAAWLASTPVDLVHVHFATPHDGTAAAAAALDAGIRVVSTDHACAAIGEADPRWDRRRHVAAWQAALVADSRAVAAALEMRLGRPVHVLPHGIDPAPFETLGDRAAARRHFAIPDEARVVGSLGGLFSSKGMHRLVEAAAALGSGVVVLVAGEGPERPRLARLAQDLGVALRLPGWLDDVRPALAAMDVLALASDSEGLPTAVLQAMAAGVPVVAADTGGVAEALGPCGMLVAPGDVAGLAVALGAALRGSLDARRGAARRRVRACFDVRRLAQDLAALHRAALAAPPPAAPPDGQPTSK
jgi:glycosyltransferase involved in cell wall biosynthesis